MATPHQNDIAAKSLTTGSTTMRRQSCDRCYGQKLRCTRQDREGTCNRCIRQGAKCVYSFSLPKGRPPNGTSSAATSARRKTSPTKAAPRKRNPVAPRAIVLNTPADDSFDMRADASGDKRATSAGPGALQAFTVASTTTSPCWNEMVVDPLELSSQHSTSTPQSLDTPPTYANLSYPRVDPCNVPEWPFIKAFDFFGDGTSSNIYNDSTTYSDGRHSETTFSGEESSGGTNFERSIYGKIAQLSQLSTRLYTLNNSACVLARTAELSYSASQTPQSLLFDDACYKIVAGWFVHLFARMQLQIPIDYKTSTSETKATGDIVHSIFSASHYLLDVLRRLQYDGATQDSPDLDLWAEIMPEPLHSAQVSNEHITSYFNQTTHASIYSNQPSHYPNAVIRHLVVACHTQILNIYVAVLIAMQHDADLRSSQLPTNRHVEEDTRLALMVQLCAYLVERQRHAVELYLAQRPALPQTQMLSMPCPTTSSLGDREMMSHLEADVQQRITQIQQMLRI